MAKKSAGDILAIVTAAGDILVANGNGSLTNLAKGSEGQILIVSNGSVVWNNQMTGALKAQANTDYTTAQIRNVIESTGDASGGNNGDIWLKYTA